MVYSKAKVGGMHYVFYGEQESVKLVKGVACAGGNASIG